MEPLLRVVWNQSVVPLCTGRRAQHTFRQHKSADGRRDDFHKVDDIYRSVVAAPYVSKLLELILPYLGIEAQYSEDDKEHEQIRVGDYTSMSVAEAQEIIEKQGIKFPVFLWNFFPSHLSLFRLAS